MTPEECREEQNGEIEAIESIYPEEITILETEPNHVFTINLRSQETFETVREQDAVSCELTFTLPPLYPEEHPLLEIESESLSEDRVEELYAMKSTIAEENLGMIMIFTIVAAFIEQLNEYFDDNTTQRVEAAELAIRKAEEAERKKFEGTKCTVENFMSWKLKFDEERKLERKALKLKEPDANKPTGYELFMTDKALDASDLNLLDPDDIGVVDVDESLFDDIDELELED